MSSGFPSTRIMMGAMMGCVWCHTSTSTQEIRPAGVTPSLAAPLTSLNSSPNHHRHSWRRLCWHPMSPCRQRVMRLLRRRQRQGNQCTDTTRATSAHFQMRRVWLNRSSHTRRNTRGLTPQPALAPSARGVSVLLVTAMTMTWRSLASGGKAWRALERLHGARGFVLGMAETALGASGAYRSCLLAVLVALPVPAYAGVFRVLN